MLKKPFVMRAPFEVGFRRLGLLATHYAGFQAATGVVCSWTVFFCHTAEASILTIPYTLLTWAYPMDSSCDG